MRISRPTETTPSARSVSAPVDLTELQRIIRVASLAVPRGPITFSVGPDLPASWKEWQQSCFLPEILPRFLKAVECARREQARDLLSLDADLRDALPKIVAARSAAAGRLGLEQLRVAKGIPWVRRYESGIANDPKRGHFAISYAIACGLFNVGLWHSILALLCEELAAATGKRAFDLPTDPEIFTHFLDPELLREPVSRLESTALQFRVA